MKYKDPYIRLHGDEIHFYMSFRSGTTYDRVISSVRSFIRSAEAAEGEDSKEREVVPLSIEMPEGDLCKGCTPDKIFITHIKLTWEKFTMLEDEVLVIELVMDGSICESEIDSSYIINIRRVEEDDIYFVDPGYNFHDN